MKKEITDKEAIGRTITGFVYSYTSGRMIITFNGDTFTTFGIKRGYESGDEEIISEKLDLFDFGDDELVKADILSKDELEEKLTKRDRQWKQQREAQEFVEYKRLKAKWEEK